MTKWYIPLGFVLACQACSSEQQFDLALASPDGSHKISFALTEQGSVHYTLEEDGKIIITPSALGYRLKDGTELSANFEVIETERDSHQDTWQTIWGQDENIDNHYQELCIKLRHRPSEIQMNLYARAFDDGVAFRYELPKQEKLQDFVIMDELTEFNFASDHQAWWGYADYDNYEKPYYYSPLSEIGDSSKYPRRKDKEERERMTNTPMTLELDDKNVVCIHEAELIDYPDMSLERTQGHQLKAHLTPWLNGDLVRATTPMKSPWRTLQVCKTTELPTSSMLLNLNAPCAYTSTDWIETFKYIGIWWELHIGKSSWAQKSQFGKPIDKPHGANTANAKRHIDFAAAHGFEEVLIEGWDKGWDDMRGSWTGYGIFDWETPTDDYDLEEVCRYAQEKGLRVMMYFETISDIDHFEPRMDRLFAMCNRLGIKTVKMGYTGDVNHDIATNSYREHHHGQYMVRHYRKMVETAAKYKLMIINHEPIKYTGEQRTLPNLMAREGGRGQEYNAWSEGNTPEHTTVMPFTRLVSGPMDYTPGIFNMKVRKPTNWIKSGCAVKSTICKEMALYLTMYSPIQMAADLPENYVNVPAFQFIKDVPTNWSESKVLHAKIGDYFTMARKERHTENWYIGSITDEHQRQLYLPLDFLKEGKIYQATIYQDGAKAHYDTCPEDVEILTRKVSHKDILDLQLAPSGGAAIELIAL